MDEERLAQVRNRLKDYRSSKQGSLLQLEIAHELCGMDVPWLLQTCSDQQLLLERTRPRVGW